MEYGQLLNFNSGAKLWSKRMAQAFSYLKDCNFANFKNGRYDIDGDNIFMTVSEYETKSLSNKKAEQHRLYIDLHCIISGQEMFGYGSENKNNQIIDEYDWEKDRTSFKLVENEVYLPLKKGDFAIFFPDDIHRPGLDYDGKHSIRKLVIKIKI